MTEYNKISMTESGDWEMHADETFEEVSVGIYWALKDNVNKERRSCYLGTDEVLRALNGKTKVIVRGLTTALANFKLTEKQKEEMKEPSGFIMSRRSE